MSCKSDVSLWIEPRSTFYILLLFSLSLYPLSLRGDEIPTFLAMDSRASGPEIGGFIEPSAFRFVDINCENYQCQRTCKYTLCHRKVEGETWELFQSNLLEGITSHSRVALAGLKSGLQYQLKLVCPDQRCLPDPGHIEFSIAGLDYWQEKNTFHNLEYSPHYLGSLNITYRELPEAHAVGYQTFYVAAILVVQLLGMSGVSLMLMMS